MPVVQGRFNKADLAGKVVFTPQMAWFDTTTTPDTIVIYPVELPITNGAFSGNVPQSQNLAGTNIATEGVTYQIQPFENVQSIKFYLLDGTLYEGGTHLHTDGFYWTGTTRDATSKRLDRIVTTTFKAISEPIYAVIPDTANVVEYASLQGVSTQVPYLDISAFRIADILTQDPIYKGRISAKFNIRGTYSASATYALLDLVFYDGSTYAWINATPGTNRTPPVVSPFSDIYWQAISLKGAAGGTGATIVGYSQATWNNSTQAAARGDVEDAITALQNNTVDLSNYYTKTEAAPRNNAVFTGTTKRDALNYPVATSEKSKEVPTAQYTEDAINAIAFSRLGDPLVYARRIGQLSLSLATRQIVAWDNRVVNQSTMLDTNGNFSIPADGNYLFYCKMLFSLVGAFAGNQTRGIVRAILTRSSPSAVDYGDLFRDNFGTVGDTWQIMREGWSYQPNLVAGEVFQVRALVDSQQLGGTTSTPMQSSGHSIAPGGGGGANNLVTLWRVS